MYLLLCIYSSDGKAEFSASLLQSLVSHHPSLINMLIWWSIIIGSQLLTMVLSINVEKSFCCLIFVCKTL